MSKYFSFILITFLLFSCKREEDPHHHDEETTDTTNPAVTLTSPADSSIYSNGDTVFISGSVTDNELHDGMIRIIDDTSSAVYYSQDPYVHGLQNVTISYFYVVNVTQPVVATLTVSYFDHHPNTGTTTRKLFFNP